MATAGRKGQRSLDPLMFGIFWILTGVKAEPSKAHTFQG